MPHLGFRQREMHAGKLGGMLCFPAGRYRDVVVIIPGSGPTDRDGNNWLGIKARSYQLLAEGLARAGIASLRIDKRGMFSSRMALRNPNQVTIGDYADDIAVWVARLMRCCRQCRIWLAGHSEGGLVAMAAAQRVASLSGLILLAVPGRTLGDVLRAQLATVDNAERDALYGRIAELEQGIRRKTVDGGLVQRLFPAAVQDFLIDVMQYQPAALMRQIDLSTLLIQGGRDLQVGVGDAELLAAAGKRCRLVILPNVNHVLKPVKSGIQDNLNAYRSARRPLDEHLVPAIAQFIRDAKRLPTRQATAK